MIRCAIRYDMIRYDVLVDALGMIVKLVDVQLNTRTGFIGGLLF